MLKKFLAITVLILLASSCQIGTAQFESNIKNFNFDPSGTVFAYIQDKDTQGNSVTPRSLKLAMTWIAFDPGRSLDDFNDLKKRGIISTFKTHDALSITFADEQKINTHTNFTSKDIQPFIQLDDRTRGVNSNQLAQVIDVKINHYDQYVIQGIIQFQFGATLIKGTFTAPILQGDAAKIAQENWEKLLGI